MAMIKDVADRANVPKVHRLRSVDGVKPEVDDDVCAAVMGSAEYQPPA